MLKKIKDIVTNNFLNIYIIYFLTLFMNTTSLIVDYPFLETFFKLIRYFTYILFLIRLIAILPEYKKDILKTKWKEKDKLIKFFYILVFVIFICMLINFINTREIGMFVLAFVLLSAYKTDYKKIIKTTMYLQIILTCIIVLLSVIGITQNYITSREEIARNSLGFLYNSNLAQMVMFSSIIYLYIENKKVKWINMLSIQIVNTFAYFLTNSRTEFIVVEVTLIIMSLYKLLEKNNKEEIIDKVKKIYTRFFTDTYILYPFISFYMVVICPYSKLWTKINNFLSNRLEHTFSNILTHGIKPFGQNVEFVGWGLKEKIKYGSYHISNFIDNQYLQIMFTEGAIFTVCFVLILAVLLMMLYKNKKYKEIILCSIYLMFGLLNPRILNIIYCPILFMIIPTIMEYREQEKE